MRLGHASFLLLLLATVSCGSQDRPIQYESVTIDQVGARDAKGELLHRYVQVEGWLSMPAKIVTVFGGGTWVTLSERAHDGKTVETSIKVGKTGASRLIQTADMYDERTLKIADRDGALLSFSDPVVIRGELRIGVGQGQPDCYIDVDDIGKAAPR